MSRGILALAVCAALVACSRNRLWIDLRTVRDDDAIAQLLGCDPERDGRCYAELGAIAYLAWVRAHGRIPASDAGEAVPHLLRADGLDPGDVGDAIRLGDYDEGVFRGPSQLHAELSTGVRVVFCCGRIKRCGATACGCNHDCNDER